MAFYFFTAVALVALSVDARISIPQGTPAAVPAVEIECFVHEDRERLNDRNEMDIDHTQSKLFRLREA
jgi:hypothetical protein